MVQTEAESSGGQACDTYLRCYSDFVAEYSEFEYYWHVIILGKWILFRVIEMVILVRVIELMRVACFRV